MKHKPTFLDVDAQYGVVTTQTGGPHTHAVDGVSAAGDCLSVRHRIRGEIVVVVSATGTHGAYMCNLLPATAGAIHIQIHDFNSPKHVKLERLRMKFNICLLVDGPDTGAATADTPTTCPDCGGRGHIVLFTSETACNRCKGTGTQ